MKIFNKFITKIIEEKIAEKENELKISDLRKTKLAKFIIDLLFNDFITMEFKDKLQTIYAKHHKYNTHAYTYDGELSVDKIYIHLLNLESTDLIEIIHNLTA